MVTSIESNHKNVPSARKGMEVCIKIDPIPGESPKMFGRHFDETDFLVSKVSCGERVQCPMRVYLSRLTAAFAFSDLIYWLIIEIN